jgi:hypothetical protein
MVRYPWRRSSPDRCIQVLRTSRVRQIHPYPREKRPRVSRDGFGVSGGIPWPSGPSAARRSAMLKPARPNATKSSCHPSWTLVRQPQDFADGGYRRRGSARQSRRFCRGFRSRSSSGRIPQTASRSCHGDWLLSGPWCRSIGAPFWPRISQTCIVTLSHSSSLPRSG